MKLRLIVLFCVSIPLTNLFAQPDSLWVKRIAGSSGGYFKTIDRTTDGGFIVGGFMEHVYNSTTDSYWLVKLDAAGDTVWTKTYPSETNDNVVALQTLDGGYAIGGAGEPWLIKTDANGTELWRKAKGTINDFVIIYDIAQTADSGFIATGYVDSALVMLAMVAKTDKSGVPTWSIQYKGEHDQVGQSVIQTFDGGYAVAGAKQHPTGGGVNHGWLMRLDAAGDTLWTATYGDTADARFEGMIQAADSGFAMVGRADLWPDDDVDLNELYYVKADKNGVKEWDGLLGNGFGDEGYAVVQAADTGFTFVGMGMIDTSTSDVNAIVVHTDAAGSPVWSGNYGDSTLQAAFDLVEISASEYLLAGAYIVDFDLGPVEGWLLRLGNVLVRLDEMGSLPKSFALHQNYPNPFNPVTTLIFELPNQVDVNLVIYDLMGRQVMTLTERNLNAGYHQIVWSGRDNRGRQMPSGIYFARMQTAQFTKTIKMVLLK